jgi:hypothetical protein
MDDENKLRSLAQDCEAENERLQVKHNALLAFEYIFMYRAVQQEVDRLQAAVKQQKKDIQLKRQYELNKMKAHLAELDDTLGGLKLHHEHLYKQHQQSQLLLANTAIEKTRTAPSSISSISKAKPSSNNNSAQQRSQLRDDFVEDLGHKGLDSLQELLEYATSIDVDGASSKNSESLHNLEILRKLQELDGTYQM